VSPEALQRAALCGAFWTAVWLYRGDRPARFVTGLVLGAGLAHLGWSLLHLPVVPAHPGTLLDVSRGFSVLFVPLGVLLLTPNAAALATLPLGLAVARLGCVAAGCCHGPHGEPTPIVEIGGLAMLHAGIRCLPERWVVPTVLAGVGLVRLVTEPWRGTPPLGVPLVAPAALAALWAAAGLASAAVVAASCAGFAPIREERRDEGARATDSARGDRGPRSRSARRPGGPDRPGR
jgi:hypothetical protein